MRHVRTNDGIGRARDIMRAANAQSAPARQLSVPFLPSRALDYLLDTLRQAVAGDPQGVDRDAGGLEQVDAADFGRVEAEFGSDLIERGLEGKAHIDCAVP